MTNSHDSTTAIPTEGRLLAVDFGTVRVGLAVCDPGQRISSPLATYTRRTDSLDAEYFRSLVAAESIVGIVVGLPVGHEGGETEKSREVHRFARWLQNTTHRPIVFYDERYSTIVAGELMGPELTGKKRRERLDRIAAHVILTAYLESDRESGWQLGLNDPA